MYFYKNLLFISLCILSIYTIYSQTTTASSSSPETISTTTDAVDHTRSRNEDNKDRLKKYLEERDKNPDIGIYQNFFYL